MPKAVMDKLRLDNTKPYKDLYSFDSSKVICLGVIKDLYVTLGQTPTKILVMDIYLSSFRNTINYLLDKDFYIFLTIIIHSFLRKAIYGFPRINFK